MSAPPNEPMMAESWAALFDRAAASEADEDAVTDALAEVRDG